MHGNVSFELHAVQIAAEEQTDVWSLPWQESQQKEAASKRLLSLTATDGMVWLDVDEKRRELRRVARGKKASLGLQVLKRTLSEELALVQQGQQHMQINATPAMRFALVNTKDSLLLAPGFLAFVTQRIQPHVGSPTAAMIAQKTLKCPFCQMNFTEDTRVVSCRCGCVYHDETAKSHPELAENDRLNCFEKVKGCCLNCHRPLTLDEYLVWDPAA